MISVEGLKVEFGVKPLFQDVSFVINDRDRIALVGKNGAGKSTMLKILCGQQKPTAGVVAIPNDTTIGYLPQVMILQDDTTLLEETRKAFAHNTKMKARLDKMNEELSRRTDYESEEYMALVEKFSQEHERYMMMGAENYEAEMERTLLGLGFERTDFNRPTSEFSGGWRMRIELAKILLEHPDVLLLDEPTNHLDIESIQWLEQFLAQSSSAVVLVSHDRAFINNVTNRTLEISCGRVIDYKVKYDEYVILRKERREQQIRAYENQQKEMADIKEFIERFRYKPYEPYKKLTGLDEPVIRFLEDDGEILTFLESVYRLADHHVRRYVQRGFTSLMFSFGCTGGQHRSVYCAQHLAEHIHDKFGVEVHVCHREQNINRVLPAKK